MRAITKSREASRYRYLPKATSNAFAWEIRNAEDDFLIILHYVDRQAKDGILSYARKLFGPGVTACAVREVLP